ncbi:hypothetical protein AB205_0061250, partial [Aquarana catesbeiana]
MRYPMMHWEINKRTGNTSSAVTSGSCVCILEVFGADIMFDVEQQEGDRGSPADIESARPAGTLPQHAKSRRTQRFAQEIKKKKGIKEEVQLTSKQKEMLQAQMEKESQIRKKLLQLDTELENNIRLLDCILQQSPPGLSQHIPVLTSCFIPLLKSPLAAARIHGPFVQFAACVMPVHLKSFGASPLSAPAFSFIFPLLKMVLLETSNNSEETEELLVQTLQIITVHSQLRSSKSQTKLIDENGPEFLPRTDMLLLLTKVIGTASPRLQGLMELEMVLPTPETDDNNGLALLHRLWVVKFDVETEIKKQAEGFWESLDLKLQPDLCSLLIKDVIHHEEAMRHAGAEALSHAVAEYRNQATEVLKKLVELYHEKLYRPPPVLDALGRVISESPPDQFEA